LWRGIEKHLGSEQVGRVVYGAIIGMALIVAIEHHPPSAAVTTATLVATALAVALAALGVIELDTAFTVAKWSGLGLITAYGYTAGRLSGHRRPRAVLLALTVTAIGAALIGFKALVH
jgi:hypothetical protein